MHTSSATSKRNAKWFDLGAKTPVIAADVQHAANRIYNATQAGRAEITITPQAWLAARAFGLAPETSQWLASLVNEHILPAPLNTAPHSPEHHHEVEAPTHQHESEVPVPSTRPHPRPAGRPLTQLTLCF